MPYIDIDDTLGRLRQAFNRETSRSPDWRRHQLRQLRRALVEREDACFGALATDLGKARQEAFVAEIAMIIAEIDHTLKHLKRWMRPKRVATPLVAQPGRSYIRPEPLGVVLVFGAWNYPLQLSLSPVVAALAAGNTVLLKPSELAPASSALIATLVAEYLDPDGVAVIEGGADVATELLARRFDHIFYTGGGAVGKVVMAAAARHLTPVTLELGGKSPCLVDNGVDIALAARRIAWGKFMNSGQTCVAPDYIVTTGAQGPALVAELERAVTAMYGPEPMDSPDYGRIINPRHYDRLCAYLTDGRIAFGGEGRRDSCLIPPTVLMDVDPGRPVMQEEIFGPILPVITVADMGEAIEFVRRREKPLALYLFSNRHEVREQVEARCPAGSVCINDTIMFMAVADLPFGGVGHSGLGAYHGEQGFRTFSHYKSILKRANFLDIPLRYPPFSALKLSLLRRVL